MIPHLLNIKMGNGEMIKVLNKIKYKEGAG